MFAQFVAWLRSLFGQKPQPSNDPPMTPVTTVYYFPIDHEGNEIGEPVPVGLNADGAADLSRLPADLRASLETSGVPDELGLRRFQPKDGSAFLSALLRTSNGYRRFRIAAKTV